MLFYFGKEHLVMHYSKEGWNNITTQIYDFMWDRFIDAATTMLVRPDMHMTLDCKIGDHEFHFSGNCPNPSYQEFLSYFSRSNEDIELTFSYEYASGYSNLELPDYLETLTEEQLDGIFYSYWHYTDSFPTPSLMAYGKHNDNFFHGCIDYQPADILPDGDWNCRCIMEMSDDITEYDDPDENYQLFSEMAPEKLDEFEMLFRSMDRFSDNVMVDRDRYDYTIFDVHLKGEEDLKAFRELIAKLSDYGIISCNSEKYSECSGEDVLIADINIFKRDRPLLEIAEIG